MPLLVCYTCYQFLKRRKEAEAEDRDGNKWSHKSVRLTQLVSQSGVPRPAGVKQKLVALLRRHGLSLGLRLTGKGSDLALSLDNAEEEALFKANAASEVEGSNDRRRTMAFVERQLNEEGDEG